MKAKFQDWFDELKPTIYEHGYLMDFEKVYKNVDNMKVELNIMNSLIGSKNIKEDFRVLYMKYPEIIQCIPILLAKREYEIYCKEGRNIFNYDFKNINYDIDEYIFFMEKTGLFNLIENKICNNLIDYVLGVEVGMNSNARKNRGGKAMEDLVESIIVNSGYILNETYFKQMKSNRLEKMMNIDLSSFSYNGKVIKKFDFVLLKNNIAYGIECNFYGSSGSKLNETARSYMMLASKAKLIDGFNFVWITDGSFGWNSSKQILEEAYQSMDYLFNINDIENGRLKML